MTDGEAWMPLPDRNPVRLAVAAGLVFFTGAVSVGIVHSDDPVASVGQQSKTWPVGHAQPIVVRGGRARFVTPSRSTTARTLVVVSALTRTPGRYPVRVSARKATRPEAPELADDGPISPPRMAPSVALSPKKAPRNEPPKVRLFHLPVRDGDPASPSNYVAVKAVLTSFSADVQVYVDPADVDRVDAATIREIVATFDEHVLPKSRSTIGVATDIDLDGRFAILVSGWLGHLADGRLSVDGYVRGADFERFQAPPIGNRSDVMYLNASLRSGPHLRTVMAHEYTHAVTYCRKALGPAGGDEEGWLDEAISHLAEDLHGFSRSNLDHRVEAFLAEPERYRLLVQDFAAADLIRSHGHRGGSYLFVRWCADRFGPDLMRNLVLSDRRGVANLEQATGRTFASLSREWSADLFLAAIRLHPSNESLAITPRASRLAPGQADDRAELDATTSHFLIVDGAETGAVEIVVNGPAEAQLQVTAIPLPDDYPRVDFSLNAEADGLVARIRERDGRRVAKLSVGWTVDPGDDRKSPVRQSLDGDRLTQILGRDDLSRREWLVSRPIAIHPDQKASVRHGRFVGRDERGRTVVSWSEKRP